MVNLNPFSWWSSTPAPTVENAAPVVSVDDLPAYASAGGVNTVDFDGEKFLGGYGETNWYLPDYWTLRQRSKQLFKDNLYARGIIRRLVTNVVNTGLSVECTPEESILGMPEDSLAEWSEDTENRFALWGQNKRICDVKGVSTWGSIQREIKREALVCGDVLIVLRQDKNTGLPQVQLVSGELVRTPIDYRGSRRVEHGVELGEHRKHVAYHIQQEDGTSVRLPTHGAKSGRRVAWMVYGTDRLMDEVRGEPLLSIILQSLREVDRYRDSTQRKAVVNSIVAAFIKKTSDKMGTLPMTGGATRNDSVTVQDSNSAARDFKLSKQLPGAVLEELQVGEEPVMIGGQGTDVNFGTFEEAIIQAVAWSQEIPPEILRLAFSNNYSASQAAINEFKIYLNKERTQDGENYCQPIFEEWLLSEVLNGNIEAPGLLQAWRDPRKYAELGAWMSSEWAGAIKPSTDILKQAKGYKMLADEGWVSRDRASKELTGTKFSKNVKKLKRENAQLAEAMRPQLELRAEFGDENVDAVGAQLQESLIEAIEDGKE